MRPLYKTLAEVVVEAAGDLGLNVRRDQVLISSDQDTLQLARLVVKTVEDLLTRPPYRMDIGTNPFVKTANDEYRHYLTNNDDLILLDGELVKLGVTWRFLHAKGFTYDEDFMAYERRRSRLATNRNKDVAVDLNATTSTAAR